MKTVVPASDEPKENVLITAPQSMNWESSRYMDPTESDCEAPGGSRSMAMSQPWKVILSQI